MEPEIDAIYWTTKNNETTGTLRKYLGLQNNIQQWVRLIDDSIVENDNMQWFSSQIIRQDPPSSPSSTPIYDFGDYRDIRGRTPVDPNLFKLPGTLILGFSGQSIHGNFSDLSGWEPSGEIYELDVYTGNIYKITSNLIMGSNGWDGRSSIIPYLAYMLLVQGKSRVLVATALCGGTNAWDWSPEAPANSLGVRLGNRRDVIIERLQAYDLTPNLWISNQGQGDLDFSKPGHAASAESYSGLSAWGLIVNLRNKGYSGPIAIGRGAYWNGYSNVYTSQYAIIKQGQNLLATRGDLGTLVIGPDEDNWISGCRADAAHLNNVGRYYVVNSGWLPLISQY